MSYIKSGQLKASMLHNAAIHMITHVDMLEFLKVTKNFKAIQGLIKPRLIIVDRNPRVQDLVQLDLGRQGCEVKVATSDREVSFLANEFLPDIICVPLGATQRAQDPVKASLQRAREARNTYIIIYHDFAPEVVDSAEIQAQIASVQPDLVVSIRGGVAALLDAVKAQLGIKSPAPRVPGPFKG